MLSRLANHTAIWALARTIAPAMSGFREQRRNDLNEVTRNIVDPDKGPDYFAVGEGILTKHIVVRIFDFTALCGLPVTSAGQGDRRDIDCPTCKRLYNRADKQAKSGGDHPPIPMRVRIVEANGEHA